MSTETTTKYVLRYGTGYFQGVAYSELSSACRDYHLHQDAIQEPEKKKYWIEQRVTTVESTPVNPLPNVD